MRRSMGQSSRIFRRCSYQNGDAHSDDYDGRYARGNWSETKISERCQKARKGQNFKRILNLSNRAKTMSSVRQESQSKRLLQVKVYSGIIMPEIQRMTRWDLFSLCYRLHSHFERLGTHWFSGTLRKWKRSGGNRKPGVCRAQAGWSGKLSSTFPFVSFHFPPIPSWMDKKHFKILILILLLHQMHRFWPHHPSSEDDKKKKRNGHPEGIPSIAYRLNFEEGSQTLVVTVLQCRCQKWIMAL